jgi:hypothetical protein
MMMGLTACPETSVETTIPCCVLAQNRVDLIVVTVVEETPNVGDKDFKCAVNTHNFFSFLRPFKFSIFLILLF